jgi:hypothetical protein
VFVPNAAGLGLRSFVNGGGTYVGTNNSSQTPVRSLGMETLAPDPQSIQDLTTPGSTFDGDFDTTNPVAWGFDLGGWIYRDSSSNAVFDPNIRVKRADGRKLRAAVKAAKLDRKLRQRSRDLTTRRTVTLVVKRARMNAGHARPVWLSRIQHGLDKRHVTPLFALL